MEFTSGEIYNTVIAGAHSVINNKETLNRINVFPVRDGDTGSNLASMMRTIIQKSERKKENSKADIGVCSRCCLVWSKREFGYYFCTIFYRFK